MALLPHVSMFHLNNPYIYVALSFVQIYVNVGYVLQYRIL
jgi:hypothetical protein